MTVRQVLARALAALAVMAGTAACVATPTDPTEATVDGQRRRAYTQNEMRLAGLMEVPGTRRMEVDATRDVCVRPQSTTFGRPAAHRLECTLAHSDALALRSATDAVALHDWATGQRCTPEGAEDLRSWGAAYAPNALPTLTYRCPDSGRLSFSATPPAGLQAQPQTIGRAGEVVVSEEAAAADELARARTAPEPVVVWVSALDDYWRK